jgi:predicted nucleic acid-binding protein
VILVDTSIWIDYLRAGHLTLAHLLERGSVLGHPWVVGELALGHLSQRQEILGLLNSLPQAAVATPAEILTFIEHHELHGLGIGYVDAQLLAATQLTPDIGLWTNDKRLAAAAARLGLGLVVDPSAPGDEP